MNAYEAFEKMKATLGGAIKKIRKSYGISREKLAEILNQRYAWRKMSPELMRDIEERKHRLSFGELRLICHALDCSILHILRQTKSPAA